MLSREIAMKLLYAEMVGGTATVSDCLEQSETDAPMKERDRAFADALVQGVKENMEELDACLASPSTVEEEIETKELARIIEDFLDTLSKENRVIFLQRYWFSDNYSDIAKKVGISEKSVSVRLTRIRKKMREYLLEREVLV